MKNILKIIFFEEEMTDKSKVSHTSQHKKKVWFMIGRRDAEYFLAMFYGKEYNMPKGEEQ